ncbi:DUF4430 domain-containing protein [Bacillus sp. BGMRC 2118]|nr:DUF4430 domain-containing protein [Bacillus sp. BGMRC 2118]
MKIKFKRLLSFLLAFTLVFGVYQPLAFANDVKETITILGSESSGASLNETEFVYQENMTAYDALVSIVGAENVELSDTSMGKMLTGINGLKAEDPFYWAFYIDGVAAPIGALEYKVQEGDDLSFHYVDWNVALGSPVSLKVEGNQDKGIITDNNYLSFIDNPTALDLLQVGLGNKIVETTDTEYGKMITSIDGLKAEGTYYWAFYVNGEMASVGAEGYELKPGDKVSFNYESWESPGEDKEDEGSPTTPPTGELKPVSLEEVQNSVDSVTSYILANNLGEWEAISLRQAGKTIPASYLENIKKVIKEKQGKFNKATDTQRYTLGILAAGGNPLNIEGYNLIEAIYNGDLTKQGLNGVAYGLIALDSANFEVPQSAKWTREKLVNHLIENQNTDGGWSWDGSSTSDLDTTGMVLSALAHYNEQPNVKEPIENAVSYLSTQYKAGKINNSSTAAQIVIGLSALGIDSAGASFTMDQATANNVSTQATSNVDNLISYLLSFQNSDGGFDWQGGDTSDSFSTAQGVQGLVAYQLFLQGKGSLYNLQINGENPETDDGTLPGENPTSPVEQPTSPLEQPTTKDDTAGNKSNTINETGKKLPNTATNSYTYLLAGVLLLFLGLVIHFVNRRNNA